MRMSIPVRMSTRDANERQCAHEHTDANERHGANEHTDANERQSANEHTDANERHRAHEHVDAIERLSVNEHTMRARACTRTRTQPFLPRPERGRRQRSAMQQHRSSKQGSTTSETASHAYTHDSCTHVRYARS